MNTSRGFAATTLVAIIGLIVLYGLAWYVIKKPSASVSQQNTQAPTVFTYVGKPGQGSYTSPGGCYGKKGSADGPVYLGLTRLDADPSTFVVVREGAKGGAYGDCLAKDAMHAFWGTKIIPQADASTFVATETGAKDAKHVYSFDAQWHLLIDGVSVNL